ncbi:organic solvent tolerance protein [Candidatus Pelagibacter sp.]|nr:organic solvent tolerance protein [Candidatus Pelagibacter sp.]
MINRIYILIFLTLFNFSLIEKTSAVEQFNFDITEIEILENGNLFKGNKRGNIKSNTGIIISADFFEYNKSLNQLKAEGNVKVIDTKKNYEIVSDNILYFKNDEIIKTNGNSKATTSDININGVSFEYNKNLNILNAKNKVKILDKVQDITISSEDITYKQNEELIFSKGKTTSEIRKKYYFESEDVLFSRNKMMLSSKKKTKINDNNNNHYSLDKFSYSIKDKKLKGENILMVTNFNLPKSDKLFFKSGFFNLDNNEFIASDTKVLLHPDLFGKENNNPRIYGSSSNSKEGVTTLNKAVFTSCEIREDNCPPWSISAAEIKHDKNKKQLIYNNATLKVYDFPILYFPKFFHPDPSVKRQSGFLRPQINNSNELGDSLHVPYFHVISENKDITIKPTFFTNSIKMFQNEYRQKNKNSIFIADFNLVDGYKSALSKTKNSISHLFAKFESNLEIENFDTSDLYVSVQKISNDTYLKVFDSNLIETDLKPKDQNNLISEIKLTLNHNENYNFTTGMKSFENLTKINSDRFQYILPYYNFDKYLETESIDGSLRFISTGSNDLQNTNNLKTKVINDLEYQSNEFINDLGFVSNFKINFKNSNTVGKNDNDYKSSPQIEIMSIFELSSSLPLIKQNNFYKNILTPKVSLRLNPSDMKNYSSSEKNITVDNIFSINRLGLDDSFEEGKSLTIGFDYKQERLSNINKYFEFKVGTVFRDGEEKFIPTSSSLNKKNSNLFGSATSTLLENVILDYDFRIDNNYKKFEYNSLNSKFIINNFETNFNFVEENGETGNENFLENTTIYNHNENNSFAFKTRRNRKINLTEFYDLIYEYKNDCLVAGIKYNKQYYEDRDLKPSENLLFTITLYPLTTYEQSQNK